MKTSLQLQFYATMDREKQHILSEFAQARRLVPLILKPRKKQQWTPQDKRELVLHLISLSRVSAYIVLLVVPGGFIMLPAMAWWLVRRRSRCAVAKIH